MLLVANELAVCQNTKATTTTKTLIMLNEHEVIWGKRHRMWHQTQQMFEWKSTLCQIKSLNIKTAIQMWVDTHFVVKCNLLAGFCRGDTPHVCHCVYAAQKYVAVSLNSRDFMVNLPLLFPFPSKLNLLWTSDSNWCKEPRRYPKKTSCPSWVCLYHRIRS